MGLGLFILIWAIVAFPLGILVGKSLAAQEKAWEGTNKLPRDANKLASEVMTDENRDQVLQRIKYHQNRVRHGANFEESYARLIRELQAFKKEEEYDRAQDGN